MKIKFITLLAVGVMGISAFMFAEGHDQPKMNQDEMQKHHDKMMEHRDKMNNEHGKKKGREKMNPCHPCYNKGIEHGKKKGHEKMDEASKAEKKAKKKYGY